MGSKAYSLEHRALPDLERNNNFDSFVGAMKELAAQNGITWVIPLDDRGIALPGTAWDLREITKDGRPRTAALRTFSLYPAGLSDIAARIPDTPRRPDGPISSEWQDFLKAVVLEYLLVRKKSIPFVTAASLAIRFLAAIADKEPWQVTVEDLQLTCELADARQPAKGTSIVLQAIMSTVVDRLHLADACPLMGLVKRTRQQKEKHSKFYLTHDRLARTLSERKAEQKLPEQRAFWELVRIVFTEKPKTLNDAIRFAMVKVLLFTGMRVGEVALLPLDWRRARTYLDTQGRPAGESGGISEALMVRHFAEKQGTQSLYETTQFVPDLFRDDFERTLAQVATWTSPLRATLKAQYETGRLFPMYRPDQLVNAVEMYVRLTGNPMWAGKPSYAVRECVERYRQSWDLSDLQELASSIRKETVLSAAVSRYFSQENRASGLVLRDGIGYPATGRGVQNKFLRISDVESFIYNSVPTKVSDLSPFTLDNGTKLAPWEMLFLLPKRAVGAGRGDTILHPAMTFSVGVADEALLQAALGDESRTDRFSLFQVYGRSEEDRQLKLKTHSFRHLQNSELFRLGIADTIITKRFNRRSVAQSYEYDHRSLAEEMDQLELPGAWEEFLGDSKAATVAKMIQAGRAQGPIVREFKRILQEEGDEPALLFLAAEADGFHSTPYGHCLNSFTVDPCPKHLECFSGCLHLSATDLPANRRNLLALHGKLKIAMEAAQARPASTVGRDNQIAHAKVRLEGVERLLSTAPGSQVFPDGVDLSKSPSGRSVLSGT